jgi:hypothetical protein
MMQRSYPLPEVTHIIATTCVPRYSLPQVIIDVIISYYIPYQPPPLPSICTCASCGSHDGAGATALVLMIDEYNITMGVAGISYHLSVS